MARNEKRRQVRARKNHQCDICGKPIRKGMEYIVCKEEVPIGCGWAEQKRHIHCDALLRFYAEKMRADAANVTASEMRCFVDCICETDCIQGQRERCRSDGFSCGAVLYLLKHRPGFCAVMDSANQCREDD